MNRMSYTPMLKNFELMFKGFFFTVGLLVVALLINTAVNVRMDNFTKLTGLPAHMSVKEKEQQMQCLTQNIYWEAASEPFEGKVAVAQVTMNRMNSGSFQKLFAVWYNNEMYSTTRLFVSFRGFVNQHTRRDLYILNCGTKVKL